MKYVNKLKLKIKLKHLAAEQRIIKDEEYKLKSSAADIGPYSPFESIQLHRKLDVRPEIRATHIAYGLLRGKKLNTIEQPRNQKSLTRKPYRSPDWKKVAAMLKKYGDKKLSDFRDQIEEMEAANRCNEWNRCPSRLYDVVM